MQRIDKKGTIHNGFKVLSSFPNKDKKHLVECLNCHRQMYRSLSNKRSCVYGCMECYKQQFNCDHLIGKKVFRWTVHGYGHSRTYATFICSCECSPDVMHEIAKSEIVNKRTKGCLRCRTEFNIKDKTKEQVHAHERREYRKLLSSYTLKEVATMVDVPEEKLRELLAME